MSLKNRWKEGFAKIGDFVQMLRCRRDPKTLVHRVAPFSAKNTSDKLTSIVTFVVHCFIICRNRHDRLGYETGFEILKCNFIDTLNSNMNNLI